ncbi:hypothetical protein LTR05_002419 [Lithohypha guttulata]|uniref:Glycosyltransferase family 34 protein n=1 Tax=Lithohypha guttulata TaxID=1690604 RepID=A0AAN7T3U5_9EURO|nr:hypothetical protein LTR05_002419 [Lithohypha guttulata]
MYEQALLTHQEHNKQWGYQHFIQRRGELGPWSKHSYILKLLVDELEKSSSQRLDWLFWHDADVLLMNNHIPLEAFLPPPTEPWAHVNFLASNDLLGLNIGVFLIRVCEWSVYFLAAGLSYPYFRPEVRLRHDEQGPLNMLVTEKKFKNNTIHVPQSWFNPYQSSVHDADDDDDDDNDASIPPEWNWRLTYFEPGDLLVHFPGTKDTREQLMQEYIDRRAANWNLYKRPLNETRAYANITHFWQEDAKRESKRQLDYWRAYHIMYHDVGPGEAMITRNGIKETKSSMEGNSTQKEIDDAIRHYTAARIAPKRESYRKVWREMLLGTRPDKTYPF